ncbi:uncharacterized protein Z518_03117 [Rhinocladiella mackenziei CBS 650.93]|uniref:Uncharacterized protein n=1 Tax=Rhinocladiella mackenziei CBS 650.93 TaxID=1442369 RepID=A0A0D2IYN2_9EURO|nr:uncharacterized protein Z518_03117 [Rhinocladiella mackenziei CBS 650.93]KIX08461.1 hypothetical protein Z518_03117 [Rhinocladiella mackenziei CBS 650.93]
MPHKHKRKRDDDDSNFDLPPSSRAGTLSVHQKQESIFTSDRDKKRKQQEKKQKKRMGTGMEDDTPKAFARLMAFQKTGKRISSGLDNGDRPRKKQKAKPKGSKSESTSNDAESPDVPDPESSAPARNPHPTPTAHPQLKILPGERLSDFSARVDQSLPLNGIPKQQTRTNNIPGLEKLRAPLSKNNRRLQRIQHEWRAEEAKLQARREEEDEALADQREEDALLWLKAGIDSHHHFQSPFTSAGPGKKRKKIGKRKGGGKGDVGDADPWKVLEKKRREEGELARQRNLQDVVLAPPVLKGVKNIFKDKDYSRNRNHGEDAKGW